MSICSHVLWTRPSKYGGVLTKMADLRLFTHEEQCGVVSLFGMLDAKAKPVLLALCCKDSVIRLYELPSFKLRARLFSRREVEAVQIGPDRLFFLGDRSGSVGVWKWLLLPKQQKVDTQ